DTAADPDHWSADNPSHGQCAVTALIVQDYFGGALLRAPVNGTAHYWNRLASGDEIDLTRQQFATATVPSGVQRTREYVLSFPDTARRYEQLRRLVASQLRRG